MSLPPAQLVALDEVAGFAYYMGSEASCREQRHLYRVPLDGSAAPERLTTRAGFHGSARGGGLAVAHDGSTFVDQSSASDRPMQAELCAMPPATDATGAAAGAAAGAAPPTTLYDARQSDPRVESMAGVLRPPEFIELPSTDGLVTLRAALYVPDAARFGSGPHPTVVSCYGGPHVQFVQDSWAMATADMQAQFLRSQGYLVVKCDNRGSHRQGLAFEAAIRGKLGELEVRSPPPSTSGLHV